MRRDPRILIATFLALAGAACRTAPTPATNAIPADSTAAAAIDLVRLRAAPAYAHLPPALKALTSPLNGVTELVLAWNGKDLLLIAAGASSQVPAGYTSIGGGLAAAGPAERIEAARRALAGTVRAAATPHPATAEIRVFLRGDGQLPLTGNLSNAANLLRMADSTVLNAHVENSAELDVAAQCPSISQASDLDRSLRAIVTLASAGARDPETAALLSSLRITRESMIVRVYAVAQPEVFQKAF